MKRKHMVVSGNIPCEACGGLTFALITTDKGNATACTQCDEVRILQAALVNPDQPPSVDEKLNIITSMLSKLVGEGDTELADLQAILNEVKNQQSLTASVNALLAQLRANSADPVAMQQILDGLTANDQALAQAVTANTPAASVAVGQSVAGGPTSGGPGTSTPPAPTDVTGGGTPPAPGTASGSPAPAGGGSTTP